jgi:hypothetical protein
MSNKQPRVVAIVQETVKTTYKDGGVDGQTLYTTVTEKQYDNGANFSTRPVEESELNSESLIESINKERAELNKLARLPLKYRMVGSFLTAAGVIGIDLYDGNDHFDKDSLIGLGLFALFGILLTEGVTAFRKHDAKVYAEYHEDRFNSQQFYLRRLQERAE